MVRYALLAFFLFTSFHLCAQDTLPQMVKPSDRYRTRLLPSLIVPAALIGYGVSTIYDNGIYSSIEARRDLLRLTNGKGGPVDDYLLAAPYLQFAALTLLKIQCRNDAINTTLLILKSQFLMAAMVFPLKDIVGLERPYSYYSGIPDDQKIASSGAFESFPSGHTAQAFVAATIVYREYRHKSPWYGVAAYSLASTVGLFRMINDKHWQSDVFAGAGMSILAANLAYATHQHRWGRSEVCFVPGRGLSMTLVF